MRYMCLIYTDYSDAEAEPQPGSPELEALYQAYWKFQEKWSAAGKVVTGEELAPVTTATTVRVRNGETLVTDGPFAETKEHLGGFYLINADDLDEAIQIASEIPSAQHGSIEVRPVIEHGE